VFFFFFFITLGLELSDKKVYEPEIRALLGTASHFCEAVVLYGVASPLASGPPGASAPCRERESLLNL